MVPNIASNVHGSVLHPSRIYGCSFYVKPDLLDLQRNETPCRLITRHLNLTCDAKVIAANLVKFCRE